MTLDQSVASANLQLYLNNIANSGEYATTTAKAAVADVGTFIGWLHKFDHIHKLPKLVELGEFIASTGYTTPNVVDEDVVREMVALAGVSRTMFFAG
ncbi:hypothetical protein SV7mr_25850 [Stieleria bergensis]|uniref:Uncharacterized protein n=1 Tax=Stieleria bergensis TaxID=2528025 RepID=A0A517SVC4_9BACT|nr:hypothetical protein SV7mr_25850 [Planctomycetes bacterium SV_7m_r]